MSMLYGVVLKKIRLEPRSATRRRFLNPPTISGGEKSSITCDGSSLVAGDVTGIEDISCKVVKN